MHKEWRISLKNDAFVLKNGHFGAQVDQLMKKLAAQEEKIAALEAKVEGGESAANVEASRVSRGFGAQV